MSDNAGEVHAAAALHWPHTKPRPGWSPVACEPFVWWCSHHLYKRALIHYLKYGIDHDKAKKKLLYDTFRSPQGWAEFRAFARGYISLDAWCQSVEKWVLPQVTWYSLLPQHHANGAVEYALRVVKDVIGNRAFTIRNQYRTNQMLELVRLRINRHADETAYTTALRSHLVAGGTLTAQLTARDHGSKNTRYGRAVTTASLR